MFVVLLLVSCSVKERHEIIGTVKEVTDTQLLLVEEGGTEFVIDRDPLQVIEVGQKVKVVYDGVMMTSNPAQLGEIESVSVIE